MKAKDLCSNILSIERNWRHVMKKQKKGRRFSISAVRQAPEPRAIEMEPEELAVYFCHTEKKVLPIIKERQQGPGAAQSLLAQQTNVLVTADPCLTTESGIAIANSVLADWQEGNFMPDRRPPTHLEETLQRLQEGPQAKENYLACFQPFTPANGETPCCIGEVAEGIVKHQETNLCQIWMIAEGQVRSLLPIVIR